MTNFFEELKRRNVIKVGIAYTVVGWLVAQVAEFATENFGAPEWVLKIFVVFLVLGLPMVLVFAWAFEMTPEGLKRERDVDRSRSITQATGQKLNYTIIALLAVALAYFVWESRFAGERGEAQNVSAQTRQAVDSTGPAAESGSVADNSIAVLPFANRSNLEDDVFFTDGIHDDLLTQLAKIRDLKVISRTSMMKYKNTQLSIPEIAAELGVSTILEGGVQRAGNRIRINAQLIDVANDEHLWAETYDREMTMENIFDIQSEITRHIISAVRGELTEAESEALAEIPTTNLQAYEAFLQARNLVNRPDYSQNNYKQAQPWAERAVAADPQFAEAWSNLAYIHGMAIWMGYDNTPERLASMKQALDRAVLLDPDSPWTLVAQAEYKYRIESDFAASLAYLEKAREQLPGDVQILERIGVTQRRLGLWEESVTSFLRAVELDPGNSRSATLAIETLNDMKDWDRVLSLTEQWNRRFPDARDLQVSRALAYMNGFGDLESARAVFDRVPPSGSEDYLGIAVLLAMLERDFQAAIDALNTPELLAASTNRGWIGWREWSIGVALRAMGRAEEADAEFRKGLELFSQWEPTGFRNNDVWDLIYLAILHAELGHAQEAVEVSSRAVKLVPESLDALNGGYIASFNTLVLGLAGQRDEALAEIERLLDTPASLVRWQLYLDPTWDFFRDDERFNELIRPLNLEEAKE